MRPLAKGGETGMAEPRSERSDIGSAWIDLEAQRTPATGRFVVLEGIDGSGKTTQAHMLAGWLRKRGVPALVTCEPSHGPVGKIIRGLAKRVGPREEVALFARDRRDHTERVIVPALRNGEVVICDRYFYSSLAYQGAMGVDSEEIIRLNRGNVVVPDLVFILEIPVHASLNRIDGLRAGPRSEFETDLYLNAVDRIYKGIQDPAVRRVNAAASSESVHRTIVEILELDPAFASVLAPRDSGE